MAKKVWILPHPDEVLDAVERWRALSVISSSDTEIDDGIRKLREKLSQMPVEGRGVSKALWRLRHDDGRELVDHSEFLAPPTAASRANRCNRAGESVLYVADEALTCFTEMKAAKGDAFYLIKYATRRKLNLRSVVGSRNPIDAATGEPIFTKERATSYRIFRDFVRGEFTRPVADGTEFLYRVSAAMCRHFFDAENCDGWTYPSVWHHKRDNVALKGDVANQEILIDEITRGVVLDEKVAHFRDLVLNGLKFRGPRIVPAGGAIDWSSAKDHEYNLFRDG